MLLKIISFLGNPAVPTTLALFIIALLQSQHASTQPLSYPKPEQSEQKLTLRKHVLDQLPDPDSTTFASEMSGQEKVLCGEYNSKNGRAGYAGYRRFIVVDAQFVDLEPYRLVPLKGADDRTRSWAETEASAIELEKYDAEMAAGSAAGNSRPMLKKRYFDERWARYCAWVPTAGGIQSELAW